MVFQKKISGISFLAALVLWGVPACQDFDVNEEILGLESLPQGKMELGLGQQTFRLEPCAVRHSKSEHVIQIIGWDKGVMRVYLELPGRSSPEMSTDAIEPILTMVRPPKPLSEDEEPVYRSNDLSVRFETVAEKTARGRIRGRVEDLMLGRTHEVRGVFECRLERAP